MYRTILFLLLFISLLSQGKAYSQKTTGNQPSQTIRGTVIDKGELEAFCQDGEFFMDMKEVLSNPSFVTTTNTAMAVTDAVINYPSVAQGASSDDVYFDDAVINIYSKKNRKDRKNISIYDREYVKTEEITTPAGTFDCTKVKFKIKSRSPKENNRRLRIRMVCSQYRGSPYGAIQ